VTISPVGGAALKERGQSQPRPEGRKTVAQRFCQQTPHLGAERPLDPAPDHVQAPKQQCDAAHEVEQNERAHGTSDARNSGHMRQQ
jgi:hypothetical protein